MHDDKKCWVCGKDNSERCSACGEAGINIFFCSRECQKLVWPIHRLFRGPGKAYPFRLPPLSASEVAELDRLATIPTLQDTEGVNHSLAEHFDSLGMRPDEYINYLVFCSQEETPQEEQDVHALRCSVALIRMYNPRLVPLGVVASAMELATTFAVAEVNRLVHRFYQWTTEDPPSRLARLAAYSTFSAFFHRAALGCFLLARQHPSGLNDSRAVEPAQTVAQALRTELDTRIKTDFATLAPALSLSVAAASVRATITLKRGW
ncbi:hypothetical protein JCM8097_004140 [Rhodosporidiobolus ruineniae]